MKKISTILVGLLLASSFFATEAMANPKKGQKYYLKKLKVCKKDGLKNGAIFAIKHNRAEWETLKNENKLMEEWKTICPSGVKKFDKMKEKQINNLYDFVWEYASDGSVPSCG